MDNQLIAHLYENGKSLREIAAMLGVSTSPIRKSLRNQGVKARHRNMNIETETLVSLYKSGLSCRQIADQLSLTRGGVSYRLVRAGLMRSVSEAMRSKCVNHAAFAAYSKESCYWAGLLAADGSISKTAIKLALKQSDRTHVKLFADWLG